MAGETSEAGDLARAFERLVEDEEFAQQVVDDPGAALADYELTEEQTEAIVADASALEGEVSGFAHGLNFAQVLSIGGLRTPQLLGGPFRQAVLQPLTAP